MKKLLNCEDFYNAWLQKYHGITIAELIEKEPELCRTPDWYKKYAVTQAQHDEWHEWAIATISKHYKWSKERSRREFGIEYLNISPNIKENDLKV